MKKKQRSAKKKPATRRALEFWEQPVTEDLDHGQLPGWHVRKNSKGYTIIELDLEANPKNRTAEAINELRRRQPNDREFQREYRRNWQVASGEGYYPEFVTNGGRELYVHRAGQLLQAPIIRGWDFGIRKPACVWAQKDPTRDRVWVLREFSPENLNTYQFRDLVLCLSGQMEPHEAPETTREAVYRWFRRLQNDPAYPDPPWFDWGKLGHAPIFYDFAGHEAYDSRAQVEDLDAARTHADILEAGGVQLTVLTQPVSARENLIRKLMMVQDDGYPGLLVDPACKLLVEGFEGGIAYAEPTPMNPMPDAAARDGVYEHVHDALGYLLLNAVGLGDHGFSYDRESMNLMETRPRVGLSSTRRQRFNR